MAGGRASPPDISGKGGRGTPGRSAALMRPRRLFFMFGSPCAGEAAPEIRRPETDPRMPTDFHKVFTSFSDENY